MAFKKGDKVKVRFGMSLPIKYKRGTFERYSINGQLGWFWHTKSGKLLVRKSKEFEKD